MTRQRPSADVAVALCLYACARYGVSGESRRIAVQAAQDDPKRAWACYRAIMNSIPRGER